ncbi:hypothetical protein MSAN_02096200 [Mycena sanguinolenta]|uniref:Uncharacterized protein n=1 Tax=Mycena sanguinolenta TaxID=230812 RepID=A0A8H6XHN8_9AGAR|nr:hypothetical protein MSAN_02096200 [Mycena sanguinolenta]
MDVHGAVARGRGSRSSLSCRQASCCPLNHLPTYFAYTALENLHLACIRLSTTVHSGIASWRAEPSGLDLEEQDRLHGVLMSGMEAGLRLGRETLLDINEVEKEFSRKMLYDRPFTFSPTGFPSSLSSIPLPSQSTVQIFAQTDTAAGWSIPCRPSRALSPLCPCSHPSSVHSTMYPVISVLRLPCLVLSAENISGPWGGGLCSGAGAVRAGGGWGGGPGGHKMRAAGNRGSAIWVGLDKHDRAGAHVTSYIDAVSAMTWCALRQIWRWRRRDTRTTTEATQGDVVRAPLHRALGIPAAGISVGLGLASIAAEQTPPPPLRGWM